MKNIYAAFFYRGRSVYAKIKDLPTAFQTCLRNGQRIDFDAVTLIPHRNVKTKALSYRVKLNKGYTRWAEVDGILTPVARKAPTHLVLDDLGGKWKRHSRKDSK